MPLARQPTLGLRGLKLREFRRFAEFDTEFGAGLTVITGANGSGKSTLLEGVTWALYGAGSVRRSEESLRRLDAPADATTRAELGFVAGADEFVLSRELRLEHGAAVVTARLCRADGALVAAGTADVTAAVARLAGAERDALRHRCVTGRRELQQLAQLGPADRLRTLARLLGRGVARRFPADRALLEAVQALQHELAEADDRIAALHTAPELLAQYSAELGRLRGELAAAEALVGRLQDEWSQKRQDVDTRLLAAARRAEELRDQMARLAASGAQGTCPTCGQPLHQHADTLAARLDDEHYVLMQDAKWLTQRQAQLGRRPPDLAEAETRRARLRKAVDDRTERAARCEQAMQELWTVAGERKRAAERLEALRREPAAAAAVRSHAAAQLSRSDLDAVAGLAGEYLAFASDGGYDGVELRDDGGVHALSRGVRAPVVSGGDEDLLALVLRLATMRLASAGVGAEFMIIDEPFGCMDAQREVRVLELLRRLGEERGQLLVSTRRTHTTSPADAVLRLDA
jgi:DNA repair exonuclease SbcCD ATPase subunit